MLQTKDEKNKMLKELLKENKSMIWFAAFFFGLIVFHVAMIIAAII